jgi:prolyl oligopeptidase
LFLWRIGSKLPPETIIPESGSKFGPLLVNDGRILAITDDNAPNLRIVELRPRLGRDPEVIEIIPESNSVIQSWIVAGERLFACYFREFKSEVEIFDLGGHRIGKLPVDSSHSIRLLGSGDAFELLFEQQSFVQPVQLCRYTPSTGSTSVLIEPKTVFDAGKFAHTQVWFGSKDGTPIPMYLVGRQDSLDDGPRPTVMTAYGGFGVPMTPQFSVLVTALLEHGCLFALPNIRGGSEFGAVWHECAKRQNRQTAIDDFNSAAEWLIRSGHTERTRLAIFGGSNAGLLVMAALTQRPELFCAVLCMVPLLDMLRYHLFRNAYVWKEEFGTADDPQDFSALFAYSPYHNVHDGTAYPAAMIVSGDLDQKCDSMHARKMTARLQAASTSTSPILLDYSKARGHSPVLPFNTRLESLTDRVAFLSDHLGLGS